MNSQELVEGEDWSFLLYEDGAHKFGPYCTGSQSCVYEGEAETDDEYVVYKGPAGGKNPRVSKTLYGNYTQGHINILPDPEVAVDVTFDDLAKRYALWRLARFVD